MMLSARVGIVASPKNCVAITDGPMRVVLPLQTHLYNLLYKEFQNRFDTIRTYLWPSVVRRLFYYFSFRLQISPPIRINTLNLLIRIGRRSSDFMNQTGLKARYWYLIVIYFQCYTCVNGRNGK